MKLVRSARLLHDHVELGLITAKGETKLRYDCVMPLVFSVIVFRASHYTVGNQRRLSSLLPSIMRSLSRNAWIGHKCVFHTD